MRLRAQRPASPNLSLADRGLHLIRCRNGIHNLVAHLRRSWQGAPYPQTAEKAYDYLATMRGVDAFLKGMPGASVQGLIHGAHSQGAIEAHQVLYFDRLMDPQSLYLTANTSTLYAQASKRADGPARPGIELDRTVPGKGWFIALRLYGPTDAWFNGTWRPGEIVKQP